jgi:hypothetical protein
MVHLNTNQKLIVNSSPIIKISKNLYLRGEVCIDIPHEIVCDLSKFPERYHSLIIQTLMASL